MTETVQVDTTTSQEQSDRLAEQESAARIRVAELEVELNVALVESRNETGSGDDGDGGASVTVVDQVRALLTSAQDRLFMLEVATQRARVGTYGVCSSCGKAIPAARLEALPSAEECVPCKTKHTRRR